MSTPLPLRPSGRPHSRTSPRITALGVAACLWFHPGIGHATDWSAGRWHRLASLPDSQAFEGSFGGVSTGVLLVAGGANFPGRKPWEGGTKVWHDTVFALDQPEGQWRKLGTLPRRLGYGVAVSHPRGIICVGGSDEGQHFGSTLLLTLRDGRLAVEPWDTLPQPLANLTGALVGDTLYVAGGTATPTATAALNSCFSLNLSLERPTWQRVEPIPGPGRILAVAGAFGGSFHVFSGAALKAGPGGPARDWLRDAYRYTPGKGWKRLADLPRAAVAAPSPAPVLDGKLILLGGDDGTQAGQPPTAHRGFPREALAYDPMDDRWERLGEQPFSLVTTPAIEWQGQIVIAGGEIKPGHRSTGVWALKTRIAPAPK